MKTLLWNNPSTTIYLVDEGGKRFARKELNQEFPDRRALRRLDNEHDTLTHLETQGVEGIRRFLDRGKQGARYFLRFAYFPGVTVADFFVGERSLDVFLRVAVDLTSTLHQIHQAGVIHRDVTSDNLLVNPEDESTCVIDFELSSRVDLKRAYLGNPERLEGTLRYLSPEQTGRINRVVDRRSDLYSLGVVLYRALVGRVPFESDDAMELIHSHIARVPEAPATVASGIPAVLSSIIMKLLEKDADDRYQSAFGLARDLEKCLEALTQSGAISTFSLGSDDHSDRFQIPQKLYGRASETAELLGAFERVSNGALELMLVSGSSGTGKTALVAEAHRPVANARGYFVDGKFDQFKRNIPYYAFIRSLEQFVALLLTEDEATLTHWADLIQGAAGREGAVLTEVLPSLKAIIGPQPPVAELQGKEAQNRFNYAFRNFIKIISRAEHPLVLFIDDLQWADTGSLDLLRLLATDTDNRHLLVICAYRDNEVSPTHPFALTVKELEDAGVRIGRIHTDNLSMEHVTDLVAQSFGSSPREAAELAALVRDKTRGNPFFVHEFLRSLFEGGHLAYRFERGQWAWDVDVIRALNVTDNVVELLASKMRGLPSDVAEVLQLAACIGDRFDLATLELAYDGTPSALDRFLRDAMIEGLLVFVDDEILRFAHDRVQQAAYSLIPLQDRPALHLEIGRHFLQRIPSEDREDRLFDIVNQLDQGVALITDAAERERLAQLNLQAGQKAKESAAYAPAEKYLSTGIELLPDTLWQTHYPLALALHAEAADASYLGADFDRMATWSQAVFDHARTLLDKVPTYETRILAFKARNLLNESIDTGLAVLAELGVEFPTELSDAATGEALGEIEALLAEHTMDELRALPTMNDPEMLGAMAIMADINSSVYWARPGLFALLVFKTVELSVKHGNCPVSAFAYSTYGVVLSGVLGDMPRANAYGELGMALLDRFDAEAWMASTVCAHYVLIVPWNEHLREAFSPLVQSVHRGLEIGSNEYAAINANNYLIMAFLAGAPLDALSDEITGYSAMMREHKQETNYWFNQIYLQTVLNLQSRSEDPAILVGDAYDVTEMLPRHLEANDSTAAFEVHFTTMILGYLFGRVEPAEAARLEATALLAAILAKVENATFRLYSSLVLLAQYSDAGVDRRAEILAAVDENQGCLDRWADAAPVNYRHKHHLVEAERFRVLGDNAQSHAHFDKAIELANDSDYLNEEALAYELAGQFFVGLGLPTVGQPYLVNALKVYRQWEATAKVEDLLARFPDLRTASHEPRHGGSSEVAMATTHSRGSNGATIDGRLDIDFGSVMRAARAISSEIDLARLVEVTMGIVIENAGADRGVLVLATDEGLVVEVEARDGAQAKRLCVPLDSFSHIAHTVTDYVSRTQTPVVLESSQLVATDQRDPHLKAAQPRSVLCLPLSMQGKPIGLIYLENTVTPEAFTTDRLAVVEALGTQAAISIEHARVHDRLEALVSRRTEQLAVASQDAQAASEAKTVFLRSMSHELRSPLNAILGYSKILIAEQAVEGKYLRGVETIQRSGEHLLSLINDVLDMSTIEAGRLELELAPTQLARLIAEVADFFRPQAYRKQLRLSVYADATVPTWVHCDARRLRQVVLNLVSNAVKFTAEGEVTVTLGLTEAGDIRIAVRDTGSGIHADQLQSVFESFVQVGGSESRAHGTGLGLAISRQIARRMGGDLSVTSHLGEGSTFVVRLPAVACDAPESESAEVASLSATDADNAIEHWPSVATLERLRHLLDKGALPDLADEVLALAETDSALAPFAETVAKHARGFDDESLEQLFDVAMGRPT